MPRWLTLTAVVLVVLSWIPVALIIRAHNTTSAQPRYHIIQDMDAQPKYKPQMKNPLFADQRAMRPPIEGTVAVGELHADEARFLGQLEGEWVTSFPVEVTPALLDRGQERYDIYCSPCHGLAGYGDGMVSKRADELQEGTWTPPSSFHTELVRSRPVGHLYNSVANGIRNMPAYGSQVGVDDRWAIVAWVKALQRSQFATVDEVPAAERAQLGE